MKPMWMKLRNWLTVRYNINEKEALKLIHTTEDYVYLVDRREVLSTLDKAKAYFIEVEKTLECSFIEN